jgi:hypothetical protein
MIRRECCKKLINVPTSDEVSSTVADNAAIEAITEAFTDDDGVSSSVCTRSVNDAIILISPSRDVL